MINIFTSMHHTGVVASLVHCQLILLLDQGDLEARLPLDQLLSCRQTHDAASHDGHVTGGRKTCSLTLQQLQPPWRAGFYILYHFIP